VAQVAASPSSIDYRVTVAVQTAAGTAALTSAFPAPGQRDGHRGHLVGVVLLFSTGTCADPQAGRLFAFPTYFFISVSGPS